MLLNVNGVVRISSEIESKFLPNGTQIVSFSVVGSKKWKEKEDTCFIVCNAFSGLAKIISDYCNKSDKIYISGVLKQEQWTDQQGQKRSKHSIIIEAMEMLTPRNNGEAQSVPQQRQPKTQMQEFPDIDITDEEVPFNEA